MVCYLWRPIVLRPGTSRESWEDAVIARLEEIRADVNAFNAQRETPYYLTLPAGAYLVQEPGLDITVMQDRADAARKSKPAENGRCAFYDAGITEMCIRDSRISYGIDKLNNCIVRKFP